MKDKKKTLLVIGALLSVVAITVGVSYAFFNYAKLGSTENSVTTGTITFLYTEVDKVGAGIKLENAIPITDTAGKMLTGSGNVFNFKVTSTTNMDAAIPYEVTARMKEGSDLDPNVVKVYLTKGETEEEVLLDKYNNLTQTSRVSEDIATEKTIYTGRVPSGSTNYEETFKLRMWVDSETDYSPVEKDGEIVYPYNNKTFILMVNVYADAKIVSQEEIDMENSTKIETVTAGDTTLTEVTGEDYQYEATLDEGTTQTTLNIETENPNSTVEIEKIDSLAKSNNVQRLATAKTVSLTDGENYFKVTVKSENNKIEDEYILMIKVGKDKTNTLNSLSVSNCTLSPKFASNTTSYTCTVENNITKVVTSATVTSGLSEVTGLGEQELVVGKNTIKVVVTAENGIQKTYTVEVTRKSSNDATLKSLSVSGYSISPTFNANTILYTVTVPNNVTSVTVNADANDSSASMNINKPTSLQVGSNIVTIEVTSGDKSTKKTYTITVIRRVETMDETDSLAVGKAVTAIDGSKWHVLEASAAGKETVVLLSDYNLNTDGTYNTSCGKKINSTYKCSTRALNTDSNGYNENDTDNVGYFIKTKYKPLVLAALPGTTIVTIPTAQQIVAADGKSYSSSSQISLSTTNEWILYTNYWTSTVINGLMRTAYGEGHRIGTNSAAVDNYYGVRPVITTLKTNLLP